MASAKKRVSGISNKNTLHPSNTDINHKLTNIRFDNRPLTGMPNLKLQTKLKIGKPGDRYEQEADAVAEKVMRMEAPQSDRKTGPFANENIGNGPGKSQFAINSIGHLVQKQVEEEEEEELLQAKEVPGKTPAPDHDIQTNIKNLGGSGKPLSMTERSFFEPRFGYDFSRVRLHSGVHASKLSQSLNARALTMGRDVVFGEGQYSPGTKVGMNLLAHELTHVVQQGEARSQQSANGSQFVSRREDDIIQGSFFGDLWKGIKSVGKAIVGATEWVGERLNDAASWVVNLIRDLPGRLVRLGQTIFDGLTGIVSFVPEAINALATGGIKGFASWLWEKAKSGGRWILRLVSRIFDVLGGPEITEFILHLVTKATPLTDTEKSAAQSVLGPDAIRWDEVRVAEGGLLSIIFHFNKGRAFATFHTINLPSSGAHGRSNVAIVVHELTHVYQYEKVGSLYLGQAIHAQATIGYGYGGAAGLKKDRDAGKHYSGYNREQQAQIAQDYYTLLASGGDTTDYDPFIAELQAGDL